MSIADFATELEANNFKKYASTRLIQILFIASKDAGLSGLASFAPDLEDYTSNNPLFKTDDELGEDHEYYGLTLDERLYKLFDLTDEEIKVIEGEK